jgi:hypothetical protein
MWLPSVLDILMTRVSRLWQWIKSNPKQAALVVLCIIILDTALLDRWGLRGRVTDAKGRSISGVWIVAVFHGKKPLINIPLPPHPTPRRDTCMDIRITRSGPFGYFSFDELTFNRPLAQKYAYLLAFKPGWLDESGSTSIASSLFSVSPMHSIVLTRGPGARRSALVNPARLIAALPPHELTFSEEFSSTTAVIHGTLFRDCGSAGIPVAAAAMQHALNLAETFDERRRAQSSCLGAESDIRRMTHDKEATKRLWPFDCRNLPFAKPPSEEALAMERELRNQLPHSREKPTPSESSTTTTIKTNNRLH